METGRWLRVRELFEECLDRAETERAELLEEACRGDEQLRREVEELLREDEASGDYMEPPRLVSPAVESLAGTCLGPWRLEGLLGTGGMSSVYLATRVDGQFEQRAAVKLIRRGMDTDDILRRFRRERQVLADLEHAAIARLIDGGASEDGRPYLVMEHVDGIPVDRFCDERRLTIEERLQLFLRVCEPVRHAHGCGIVHRDLKPSNILVTGDGKPKLLDFGIAKVLNTSASARTVEVTATEQRLLTPEYASPEQIRGGPIGEASDVYSLGVVLYELLTGHRPYAMTTRLRGGLERVICDADPPRPSTVVGRRPEEAHSAGRSAPTVEELSARRGMEWRSLRARLAGDLDTIVLMALRKEPERRYATVAELEADLERALAGRPVLARPDTWGYRASRFVRRNRAVVGWALGVMLVMAVGLAVSSTFWLRAERARELEAAQRTESEWREYVSRVAAAGLALRAHDAIDARRHLEAAPETLRGWEWRHFMARTDRSARTLSGLVDPRIAFSPDGRWLAVGDEGGAVLLWDVEEQREGQRWTDNTAKVHDLDFDGQSERLAVTRDKGVIEIRSVAGGDLLQEWRSPEGAGYIGWGPDGGYVVSSALDGSIRSWNPATGAAMRTWESSRSQRRFAIHPRGDCLVTASRGPAVVTRWDLETGESADLVALELAVRITGLEFLAGGEQLLVVDGWGNTLIVNAHTGETVRAFRLPTEGLVEGVAVVPGEASVVTAASDGSARICSLVDGGLERVLLGHAVRMVRAVAVHPDGELIASAGEDGVRLWAPAASDVRSLRGNYGWRCGLAVHPGGEILLDGGMSGMESRLTAWTLDGMQLWSRATEQYRIHDIAFHPDGTRFATVSSDDSLAGWDLASRDVVFTVTGDESAGECLAYDRDGGRIATSGGSGSIVILDAMDGTVLQTLDGHTEIVLDLEFTQNGRLLSGSGDGTAGLWDVARRERLLTLDGHEDQILAVAIHPDEVRGVTASRDGTLKLWDLRDGRELATLVGHTGSVSCIAFSPDGSRVVSGSHDGTLRLWATDDGREVATLHGHMARIEAVAFTADGETLVSKSHEGVIMVRDTIALDQ